MSTEKRTARSAAPAASGEHGKAGVAIREGVEEGHVQVGPGRTEGQGDSPVGALAQTALKSRWVRGVSA